jgi:hypothetical protein
MSLPNGRRVKRIVPFGVEYGRQRMCWMTIIEMHDSVIAQPIAPLLRHLEETVAVPDWLVSQKLGETDQVEFLADAPSFANTAGGEVREKTYHSRRCGRDPRRRLWPRAIEETEMTEKRRIRKSVSFVVPLLSPLSSGRISRLKWVPCPSSD